MVTYLKHEKEKEKRMLPYFHMKEEHPF